MKKARTNTQIVAKLRQTDILILMGQASPYAAGMFR